LKSVICFSDLPFEQAAHRHFDEGDSFAIRADLRLFDKLQIVEVFGFEETFGGQDHFSYSFAD